MKKVLKIHPDDNVLIALVNLRDGEEVHFDGETYTMQADIPAKHKFVTQDIEVGELIMMYGVVVGRAEHKIRKGEPITTQNLSHQTDSVDPETSSYNWEMPNSEPWKNRTFLGYHRPDGKVGVANYWIIAPLVFCENRNIDVLRESMLRQLGYPDVNSQALDIEPLISAYRDGKDPNAIQDLPRLTDSQKERIFPNIDGIKFLTHHLGCGGNREDAKEFCELLAGYISNPNVAGATIVGLGCQDAEQSLLEEALAKRDPDRTKPVFFHEQQQSQNEKRIYIKYYKINLFRID